MALFQRLKNEGDVVSEDKGIAIHAFCAALFDYHLGHTTAQEIVDWFDLDGSELTQASTLRDLMVAHPDTQEFLHTLKTVVYLAEMGMKYTDGADALARLQASVTDAGGTLP